MQWAAKSQRQALLEHGVRYPGKSVHHRKAVAGLFGRPWGSLKAGNPAPPVKHRHDLMSEVEAGTQNRIWISNEHASEAADDDAKKFVDALGDRTHIVITLRNFGELLPSTWQEYMKGAVACKFEDWLRSVLADPPKRKVTPSFYTRNDQGGVVERWSRYAGAENETVIIADNWQPDRISQTFEQMFGLPDGMLTDKGTGDFKSNRSLTRQEAELFCRMNLTVKGEAIPWAPREKLVRQGAVKRLLTNRDRGDDERATLPGWAADRAAELGNEYAERIATSGVRVVGELVTLRKRAESKELAPVDSIPIDIAAEALSGMLSAGLDRGAFFASPKVKPKQKSASRPKPATSDNIAETYSTKALAKALGKRLKHKIRTGRSFS